MKQKLIAAIALLSLCLSFTLINAEPGRTQAANSATPQSAFTQVDEANLVPPVGCAVQPPINGVSPSPAALRAAILQTGVPVTLTRFRASAINQTTEQTIGQANPGQSVQPSRLSLEALGLKRTALPGSSGTVAAPTPATNSAPSYTPREQIALADPTNYGDRFLNDLEGRPAYHDPIVVLHETVGSASSAINFFQTPHPRDDDQASYHTLVKRDGTLVYLVPPDKRAFGAGDSAFNSTAGVEAVQTKPDFPPSVNNFAYHISLETPPDGDNNGNSHSGYTNAQYQSLAWLTAKTGIPTERITTHKLVDRSGTRKDPRSFNAQAFLQLLDSYPKTQEIAIGCPR